MTQRLMINQFMRALVAKAGGPANAASLIDIGLGIALQNGESSRVGTVSKRLAGHLDWPLIEIMALEDALGDQCIRRWLLSTMPGHNEGVALLDAVSALSQETGEAVSAVISLAAGRGDHARARKELQDAKQVIDRLAAALEGGAE